MNKRLHPAITMKNMYWVIGSRLKSLFLSKDSELGSFAERKKIPQKIVIS